MLQPPEEPLPPVDPIFAARSRVEEAPQCIPLSRHFLFPPPLSPTLTFSLISLSTAPTDTYPYQVVEIPVVGVIEEDPAR